MQKKGTRNKELESSPSKQLFAMIQKEIEDGKDPNKTTATTRNPSDKEQETNEQTAAEHQQEKPKENKTVVTPNKTEDPTEEKQTTENQSETASTAESNKEEQTWEENAPQAALTGALQQTSCSPTITPVKIKLGTAVSQSYYKVTHLISDEELHPFKQDEDPEDSELLHNCSRQIAAYVRKKNKNRRS